MAPSGAELPVCLAPSLGLPLSEPHLLCTHFLHVVTAVQSATLTALREPGPGGDVQAGGAVLTFQVFIQFCKGFLELSSHEYFLILV